jgi:hypothetical protein
MSKKSSWVTVVVVILAIVGVVVGGKWLWHFLLKMHGMG